MELVTKSLRLPENLVEAIQELHSSKETFKKFSFSDYAREALEEKYEKEKKSKKPNK